MKDAGIATAADVHFVQIKCPLLTKERIEEAERRGATVATDDTYHSMALSRGASALGVALALDEIDDAPEAAVCHDWSLYSTSPARRPASSSCATKSSCWATRGMGGRPGDRSRRDEGRHRRRSRPPCAGPPGRETVAVLAKAEAAPSGEIRGRRHTMLDDSDIHSTRHARALVGGVLAGVIGDTLLYVSGGAEHQGPPGGGPVAIIAKV